MGSGLTIFTFNDTQFTTQGVHFLFLWVQQCGLSIGLKAWAPLWADSAFNYIITGHVNLLARIYWSLFC